MSEHRMSHYVLQLPLHEQLVIAKRLRAADITGEDFERAMCSKVIDLEDTIDVSEWKGQEK